METAIQNSLSQLLTILRFLRLRGRTNVSTQTMAENLRISNEALSEILTTAGIGVQGNCEYEIGLLLDVLETLLGHHSLNEAFIAGAGKMGSRLIQSKEFKRCGLMITAAFDVDTQLIGTEIDGVKVVNVEKLTSLAHRMHIALGIITTPPDQAQKVADLMVAAKIQVIWNFTPCRIIVPDEIILENTSPNSDLTSIFHSISERFINKRPWTLNLK
ncbi:MAG: redox-sensing transcriptional repressor Rex [Bacteroidetes bacterium]|nr:redox-sensing transcriptional repressor Rex [Bacteroidota bacterium]